MPNATLSTQPLAANDARPPRPAYFTTKGGADSHAQREARSESPSRTITGVPLLRDFWRAVEGGPAYEVRLAQFGDYEVRQVTEYEIARRQQAAIRTEIAALLEHAATEDLAASKARVGSCFVLIHQKWAAQARETARELERLLTISGVRQVETFYSSERDNREASSR